MKELLCIAFILFSPNLWSLVEDDVSFIETYDLVKSDVRKKMDGWDVNPTELDTDSYRFKGQARTLIGRSLILTSGWTSMSGRKKEN
jgi:hypothetical protein